MKRLGVMMHKQVLAKEIEAQTQVESRCSSANPVRVQAGSCDINIGDQRRR